MRLNPKTRSHLIDSYGSCYTVHDLIGSFPQQLINPDLVLRLSLIVDLDLNTVRLSNDLINFFGNSMEGTI